MEYATKTANQNFDCGDSRFNLTKYKSLVQLVAFSSDREHTDGLCCFLPTHWRNDKQVVSNIYLIHGTLVPSGEIHRIIYEGKAPPPLPIPEDVSETQLDLLIKEYEELCERTPHRTKLIPDGERFRFEGFALPACSNLDFNVNDNGGIIVSCSTYATRDNFCKDYPVYGTSEFDPFCVYDGWSTEPNVFELEPESIRRVQIKFFAVKHNLTVPESLVFDRLELDKEAYNLIPVPIPKRCCKEKCLEHSKYENVRKKKKGHYFGI